MITIHLRHYHIMKASIFKTDQNYVIIQRHYVGFKNEKNISITEPSFF